MIRIALDTKGADKGALPLVKGVSLALEAFPDVGYLLVGDAALLARACEELALPAGRVEILDAPEEITCHEAPAEAILKKGASSMVRMLEALSGREELFGGLTAGSTGALLVGAMRYLPKRPRVRPALASLLPAEGGGFVCVVDTGATVDCTPELLQHFAHLGREYMQASYRIEAPRIGLLSNGAEPEKGNRLVKETHPLLKADGGLNFIGNVEGTRALSGICDVLVCDGFAGNQVLKVTEGTAKRVIADVVGFAKRTQSADAAALVKQLLGMYDIESLGGAHMLGIAKPVIKMHGSAGERTVVNSTRMLLNMAEQRAAFDADMFCKRKGDVTC